MILCEEIRKEENGKLIFIGVYPDNVLALKFPTKLKLAFWICGETCQASNKIEFEFSAEPLTDGENITIAKAEMELNISEDKLEPGLPTEINFWIEGLLVGFEKQSKLTVRGREKGGRWKPIGVRKITIHPDHASEPGQPS